MELLKYVTSQSRHNKEQCSFSVSNNKEFKLSREVSNGKTVQLQQSGEGKMPRKVDHLTMMMCYGKQCLVK